MLTKPIKPTTNKENKASMSIKININTKKFTIVFKIVFKILQNLQLCHLLVFQIGHAEVQKDAYNEGTLF